KRRPDPRRLLHRAEPRRGVGSGKAAGMAVGQAAFSWGGERDGFPEGRTVAGSVPPRRRPERARWERPGNALGTVARGSPFLKGGRTLNGPSHCMDSSSPSAASLRSAATKED